MPPTQRPLRLEAAILSRMRSEVTSRSNWANDSSTFSVSRPIEVVVLNCWVTDTKDRRQGSGSDTCGLVVEVKHYKRAARSAFGDVLDDYARAFPQRHRTHDG